MFNKVYPMSKKPVDFRDNPFRLVEVSRNGSFPKKASFQYNEDDFEDLMDEELEVGANPIYGNAGYDDEDDDYVGNSVGHFDEEEDSFGACNSANDDDDNSHGHYDAANTDWGAVDFAAVDWSQY